MTEASLYRVNESTGLFEVHLSRSLTTHTYNSLGSLFKNIYHFSYDPSKKIYYTSNAIEFLASYDDALAIDPSIKLSPQDKELLSQLIYPHIDLVKTKLPLPYDFFKQFPPLKGKEGKEDFQINIIKDLLARKKVIADVYMRHGKTYCVCGALYQLFDNKLIDKVLIIAREEGLKNFKDELLKFLPHHLREEDIGIVTAKNRDIETFFNKKIIITTYSTFRLSCEYKLKQPKILKNGKPSKAKIKIPKFPKNPCIDFSRWGERRMLICDEAQELNHFDTLQTHHIYLESTYFERIIEMSGTLGYTFDSYYSLVKILYPDMLPYSHSYWLDYVAKRDTFKHGISGYKPDRVLEFKHNVISKLQVSYTDCVEIQPQHSKVCYLDMPPTYKDIYQNFTQKEINNIRNNSTTKIITGKTVENHFMRLTQVTSDPSLLPAEYGITNWNFEDNPKYLKCQELLKHHIEVKGEKVIIWTLHPKIAKMLYDRFSAYNPIILTGDKNFSGGKDKRQEELLKFKQNPEIKLLIATYIITTSISLIEATTQIFYDLNCNTDDFMQCKERIGGPMQTKETNSFFLLFDKSIDVYIWDDILSQKKKVKEVLGFNGELSLADYKSIFARGHKIEKN